MYFETEQASMNTTEKTQSAAAQLSQLPINDLTFPPVDGLLGQGRDAE